MKPLILSIILITPGCISQKYHQAKVKESREWGLNKCESYLGRDFSDRDILALIRADRAEVELMDLVGK